MKMQASAATAVGIRTEAACPEITAAALRRYRRKFGVEDATPNMVAKHWQVEAGFTRRLKESNEADRWEIFEECYTNLYQLCPWLNREEAGDAAGSEFAIFIGLLGRARTIFEIGSGKGDLIKFLAARGFSCVASEITRERGAKFAEAGPNLCWTNTDGVHLAEFTGRNRYDAVISSQLIEHLHPEDLSAHFRGALEILKPGGKYIFDTPHYLHGPCDLSEVFDQPEAICMHLKEYFYFELTKHLRSAGFEDIKAVLVPPRRVLRRLPIYAESRRYLTYVENLERLARAVGKGTIPRPILWLLLLTPNVFLTAKKPSPAARERNV